jgi:hypothetical protein
MLGLLARLVQPLPSRTHDHLFTPYAPDGAPAQVLRKIYHQYDHLLADELMPPQHRHFRALVRAITGGEPDRLRRLDGLDLRRICSAYVSCFERSEPFEFQLALWRRDHAFRTLLIETRERVIEDLVAHAAAETARRLHYSRWKECLAFPIDLPGESLLEQVQKMGPDDWHEIVLHWDWNARSDVIAWVTSQRNCDRATAVFALCAGHAGDVAARHSQCEHDSVIRAVAARLEGGFYPNAELGLNLPLRTQAAFEGEIETARAMGVSPWQLPEGLVSHPGTRAHAPKYAVSSGRAHYHYEYWLAHVAPRR